MSAPRPMVWILRDDDDVWCHAQVVRKLLTELVQPDNIRTLDAVQPDIVDLHELLQQWIIRLDGTEKTTVFRVYYTPDDAYPSRKQFGEVPGYRSRNEAWIAARDLADRYGCPVQELVWVEGKGMVEYRQAGAAGQ